MAEDFQAAVCGGSWWMSPRTAFNRSSCSSVIMDMENFGPFWPKDLNHLIDMKSKSTDDSLDGSMVFQDIQKPGGGTTTTMLPESTFQRMTAFSTLLPTTNTDWNQNLLFKVQEGVDTFLASGDDGSTTVKEAGHQEGFTMDQQQSLKFVTSSSDCTTFPISSTSYLLQSLFDSNSPPQPLYDSLQSPNSNNFNLVQSLPSVRPKQQVPGSLHLTNNNPIWDASVSPLHDDISSFFPSPQPQFPSSAYKEKKSYTSLTVKPNHHEEIQDSGLTAKKSSSELPFKRPRLETPSPLPTFKVRKEKLGDRITALQQLVSPFGKTDTASVLHEAIEYIKLLHDQVNILSAPYTKNGPTKQPQQVHDKVKDVEGTKQDLRSLGLCLVPVSSTFPVATEMATGFWTPSFEGPFRYRDDNMPRNPT